MRFAFFPTAMPQADEQVFSYKPSAWYYRDALRNSRTTEEAIETGLQVVLELESLKEFVREKGLIPPKSFILEAEARDKGWPVQAELRFSE